ncbi:unnamed protein product [Citrullus colocynthis]|uniref:Cytochrome P450 n=1 Tax=Citrullus colocynthis TaxID=252529 RepID=A0ABP0XMH9_9ROSI
MEIWLLLVIISLSIYFLIITIFNKFQSSTKLPPGPPSIPILTNFLWLRRSPLQIESLLRSFIAKYGPILPLPIGPSPAIVIAERSIAHKALLQNAALFADRPTALAMSNIISTHHYNLASAPYGPLWRLLRRNLTSQILHPSRVKSYARSRKWYAMIYLLVIMCFGDKFDETQIKEIENVEQEEEFVVLYVDTLLDLELPDEKRKLTDDEIVTLCSEFLNAGTDTTSTTLQWIMANLVKYPEIQNKLFVEMKGVMGDGSREEVKEEDLGKLPYSKAVVLEGLRRHPPVHFVVPHAVKEDTELENYVIPRNGSVHFMVAEMGWDSKVWEDPMEFKPERFMKGGEEEEMAGFDLTGSKEIKMMPFGVGRRICPAIGLAMLHLEYFIANLVWRFQWKAVDGDAVDLAEKIEFTVLMKRPLKFLVSIC